MRTALQLIQDAPGVKVSAFMFWRKKEDKKISDDRGVREHRSTRRGGTIAGFNYQFNDEDGFFSRREDKKRVNAKIVIEAGSVEIVAVDGSKQWSLSRAKGNNDHSISYAIELAARKLAEHGIPREGKDAD